MDLRDPPADLDGLALFVAVVDAGSISAAARALGQPRETLSRRLSAWEDGLGVRLLHRSTRRLQPTRAGETLLARARPLLAAARESLAEVRLLDDVPRGLLRVSVPPGGGAAFLGSVFATFLAAHPEVQMEVRALARHVDLVGEGYDVALRAGSIADPNLIARRLWSADVVGVMAPALAARVGLPATPEALEGLPCILGFGGGESPLRRWPLRDGRTVPVQGRLASDDLGLLLAAAEGGAGVALLPAPLVAAPLAAGRLLPVLPSVLGAQAAMSVVTVERTRSAPRVRAFVAHVVAWFAREGGPSPSRVQPVG